MDSSPSQEINSKEQFWQIKPGSVPTDDPLLTCLVMLTRFEHKPFSPESLASGLPLIDGKLTPELFVRAAKRANISSQIVKRKLSHISPLVLPAVLLLKNRQACLLIGFKKGKMAQIIQPETNDGVKEVKLEKLNMLYEGHAIFTNPTYKFDSRSDMSSFTKPKHWFVGVIKKVIPMYLDIIVASILINFFALVSPLFTMNVYDRVVPNNAMETLIVLSIGILTVHLFDFLMKLLRSYFIDLAGKKADILLSASIFEQLLGVRMEERPDSVGAFANQISMFDSFRDFITSATMTTVIDVPFILIFVAVIYYIGGPYMALIPIFAIPTVVIAGLLIQGPLESIVKESYKYTSQKQAMLIEALIGVESIKTIGAESNLQKRWEQLGGLAAKISQKSKILSTIGSNMSGLVTQVSSVALVIVGVSRITEGEMTMGALIACNMLNGRALAPLGQIASLITRYHQAMTSFHGVDNLMNMQTERPPGKTPLHRDGLNGQIEFKDVSFQYPKADDLCLKNISFKVMPGEKVGIIGRIGSGKTTIEKLLMGLYMPTEGSILFDGTESQQLDPSMIRRNIGYVSQDITLFYGTVKDNIVMGAPYADDSAVLRAASIAGVTEFVSHHPKGFDLEVGERGEKLSGGQRQSIAIARALLLDPNILILDEPTNMMDSRSEELFKFKMNQILANKTVILITHKGGLLSLVDRVILVDSGGIAADGPKDEVIKALSEGKLRLQQ